MRTYPLGRLQVTDERDHDYPIRQLLPRKPSKRLSRYWWDDGWWGNQGETNQCVAYSFVHWLKDGPILQAADFNPHAIYAEAQRLDEIPGENYEGTTVRGGVKALVARGLVKEYRWAFDVYTVIQTLLELGPVVVGTNWYESMFVPDAVGRISIGGNQAGGHAYVLNGVSRISRQFRIKNSWGREWGRAGHAFISFDNFSRLLGERGEACLAVEISKPA